MNILQQLKEPFPDRSKHGQNLISLFGVGIFVSLFLYIIRPFGIEGMGSQLLVVCIGFGGVTVLFGWIYDVISRFILKIKTDLPSWTLWKWILHSIVLIIWIAFGNFLYMNYLSKDNWYNWNFLLHMLWYTVVVGIFPIVFSGFTIQLKAVKLNKIEASQFNKKSNSKTLNHSEFIILESNAQTPTKFLIGDIRYVEAMQNYVIIYLMKEGGLQRDVVRGTISGIENELKNSSIARCHRSYLVNTSFIQEVNGNAQGLKLKVKDVEGDEVPVSRSYISSLKQQL